VATAPTGIVWVTLENGRVEQHHANAMPAESTLWCHEGDAQWTPLARTTPSKQKAERRCATEDATELTVGDLPPRIGPHGVTQSRIFF
jgi:hypothetical protein